jgi:hypothetical protein
MPNGARDERRSRRYSCAFDLAEHIGEVDQIIELVEMLETAEELTNLRPEELQLTLVHAITGTKTKVDDTSHALACFETAIMAAKAEEQRLKLRRDYFQRQKERLETYVLALLSASNLPRIEGVTSTQTCRQRICASLPRPRRRRIRRRIERALKAGEIVPGCRLVQKARLMRS